MSFALTIARHAERSRLWEMTAPLVSDNLPPAARAAWAAACSGHWYWRKSAKAIRSARLAVRLCTELHDASGTYRALSMLGMATARADLRAECEQACAALRGFDEPAYSARLQFMACAARLGLADRQGDVDAMQRLLRRQLALAEAAGDSGHVQNALSSLADTELAAGQGVDAAGTASSLSVACAAHATRALSRTFG